MSTMTVRVGKRGVITIPVELRRKYDIKEGDIFSILDLDGVFVLSPGVSEIEKLAGETRKLLSESGVSLEDLLDGLEEQRGRYYREHYGDGESE